MQIGGKEVRVKPALKLIEQKNSWDIAQIHDQLAEWIQDTERKPETLQKLEDRWKKICGEVFDDPVPTLSELGVTEVREVVSGFFTSASIAKQSEG